MNVLSLFDGISCGQVALKRAGIKVDNYYASEIDRHAIKVTQTNFPNTIQLGDITKISIKSFFLSGVDSIFGVNSINDTNLQNIIPEWEMLYWLNKEFSVSTTIGAQKPNEKPKIQSSTLQCVEEIRFSKCDVGDIIRTRNIERCRTSGDFSDQKQYSELQCGEWWYVYRGHSGNPKKNFGGANGEESFRGDKRKAPTICNSTVSIKRIESVGVGENQVPHERSNMEKEISGWTEKDRYEETGSKETRNRSEKESNPLSDFEKELRRWHEIDETIRNNRNFLSIHPKTQITVVKHENGIIIFNGIFQILFGGSPCQSFSKAGNQTGFEGKSGLFYTFVDVLKSVNPKHFLMKNVEMKKEWEDEITSQLGVNPIKINSKLVSAQSRPRIYWANFAFSVPQDKGILLPSIIEESYDGIWVWPRGVNSGGVKDYGGKSPSMTVSSWSNNFLLYKKDLPPHKYNHTQKAIDYLNRAEMNQRFVSYEGSDKSPCVTANFSKGVPYNVLLAGKKNQSRPEFKLGSVRKFTPEECEKLQTLPPGYTSCVSDTQRYKSIGNGWTVDVIAHILRFLPKECPAKTPESQN